MMERKLLPILIVEDSPLLLQFLASYLENVGYTNLICVNNGLEAWKYLLKVKTMNGPINNHVACMITKVEMPEMDGYRLINMMKKESSFQDIPIVIFVGLLSEDVRRHGSRLGADALFDKVNIRGLRDTMDHLLKVS